MPGARPCDQLEDREDVVLAHQQDLLVAVELELLAGVGGEQDDVADLHLQLAALAVLGDPAVAHRDNLALLRLVLRGVGQNDPTGRRVLGLFPLNDHAIAQRLEIHRPCLLQLFLMSQPSRPGQHHAADASNRPGQPSSRDNHAS